MYRGPLGGSQMGVNSRKLYLDILRIGACFLVIFNHLPGYTAYQSASGPVQTFGYMFLTMFTRVNVPLFLMLSGSLLLSRDIGYKDLFGRVMRIVGAIIVSTTAVYCVAYRHNISNWNIVTLVRMMINGSLNGTYWYLYAYLGFLIVLPFMRSIAKNLRKQDFIALLVGHCVLWTLLPLGNYVLKCWGKESVTLNSNFIVPFMSIAAFFYPLLGYYLDKVLDISKITGKKMILLCVAALAGIGVSCFFTYHQGVNSGFTQDFVQMFDYLTTICIFLLTKFICTRTNNLGNSVFWTNALSLVSSLTFGIYLLEPVLKLYYNRIIGWLHLEHPLLISGFWCFFAMVVCGTVTYLLKKIPFIKKIF